MTKLTLSRFNRTRGGYMLKDHLELGQSGPVIDDLNVVVELFVQRSGRDEPSALSLSTWSKGAMSGDTWQHADGLLLEYMSTDADNHAIRGAEIVAAASALDYGFYLLDTCTRDGRRTWSVFWHLDEPVNKNQYVRLASVMAERMNCYQAADGIVSQTHLVHLHPGSNAAHSQGGPIPSKTLIHQTAKLYQNMNPTRFQRNRPASGAAVQLAPPVVTSSDNMFADLFSM